MYIYITYVNCDSTFSDNFTRSYKEEFYWIFFLIIKLIIHKVYFLSILILRFFLLYINGSFFIFIFFGVQITTHDESLFFQLLYHGLIFFKEYFML